MTATAWKGHLAFGLISIPVRLYAAARKEGIQLHQIHKKCRTRIRQPLFCPTCNRIVSRSEVIKGYEYEKDQYFLLEEEELKKIAPLSERTMGGEETAPSRRQPRTGKPAESGLSVVSFRKRSESLS